MSSAWKYVSEAEDTQISEIWCDGAYERAVQAGIRIFPWRVRMSSGEVRGLYSLNVNDFSGADKEALENALKNAKELRDRWSGENSLALRRVQEVEPYSCWSCC
jgi:hypothetical protein